MSLFFRGKHGNCDLGKPTSLPSKPIPAPQQGACTRCKSHKVKCEYPIGSSTCRKCIDAGLENACQPGAVNPSTSRKRSSSTAPTVPAHAKDAESLPGGHVAHSNHVAPSNHIAPLSRISPSDRMAVHSLAPIVEAPEQSFIDNNYTKDTILSFQRFISDNGPQSIPSGSKDNSSNSLNKPDSDGGGGISSSEDSIDELRH